jgi:hypothetical protein
MQKNIFAILFFVCQFSLPYVCEAGCSVVLCKDVVDNKAIDITSVFLSDEKIYVFANVYDSTEGDHKLKVEWYNPKGDLERTHEEIFSFNSGVSCVWSWFEITEKLSSAFVDVNFYGQWRVKIYIDSILVWEKFFTMV